MCSKEAQRKGSEGGEGGGLLPGDKKRGKDLTALSRGESSRGEKTA